LCHATPQSTEWRNPVGVNPSSSFSQGSSQSLATLGYKTQPRWGKNRKAIIEISTLEKLRNRENRSSQKES
jgi:hypothetical protein